MAAIQSRELPPQELMRLENGEEETFRYALSKSVIKKSNLDDLEGVLRLIMLKIGLRAENLPSKEEKAVIIDHILSVYGNHTIDELRLAFEMAVTFKLDLTEKEIICYENFSCMYISKIMNAYRKWASDAYKFLYKVPTPTLIEGQKELSDSEWNEWLEDMRNYDPKILPCAAYDYLVKQNKLILTNEEKHQYMERSIAQLLGYYEPGTTEMIDFLKMKEQGVYNTEITATLITISKRLAIYDYLQRY